MDETTERGSGQGQDEVKRRTGAVYAHWGLSDEQLQYLIAAATQTGARVKSLAEWGQERRQEREGACMRAER